MRTRGALLGPACMAALLAFADATPARAAEIRFRGLIDVVGAERGTGFDHNLLTRNDSNFDAYSLRAFAEATANDQISIFTQFMPTRGLLGSVTLAVASTR